MKNVYRIVLTGGPCGGKTSALAHLREKLEELGYIVILVPEAATLCISAGINPGLGFVTGEILQTAILGVSIDLENRLLQAVQSFGGYASTKKGVVVLYDRGLADGRAYTTEAGYTALLDNEGLHPVAARDERYDAILHMVTAANGAEDFYTLANNAARHESPEEARALDLATQDAWTGAPHFRVIDNRTDFQGKLRRVLQEVCVVLGEPVPVERERKFTVSYDPRRIPRGAQVINIEQRYLASPQPGVTLRVRKRGQGECFTYSRTEKSNRGPGERLEIERVITKQEYEFGASLMRADTKPVIKQRTCLVHKGQYFELDRFASSEALPALADGLLELEVTDLTQEISFPDWMTVLDEVTDDPYYSNERIAERIAQAA